MNLDGVARTVILALALWALHELIVVVYPWSTYAVSRVALLLGGLYCILVGYAALYFSYCVFDSSKGGARAPAILPIYAPDKSDLRSQFLLVVGGVALYLGPAAVYRLLAGRADVRFCVLAALGAFLLPMILLRQKDKLQWEL
jgi:hypothetical protein